MCLKQTCLLAVLIAASTGASAEWFKVSEGDTDGGYRIYLDPQSVRKAAAKAKVWTMTDYTEYQSTPGGVQYKSIMAQHEYDCKEGIWRTVLLTAYKQGMAEGRVVHAEKQPSSWAPVIPDTSADVKFKLVCKYL